MISAVRVVGASAWWSQPSSSSQRESFAMIDHLFHHLLCKFFDRQEPD
jgi:hypothetical protein